jgi:hypothetical protein
MAKAFEAYDSDELILVNEQVPVNCRSISQKILRDYYAAGG